MSAEMVVSWLVSFLLDQCKTLIDSELSTILNATEDLRNLERILSSIQSVLLDAEKKQLKDHSIANWLSQLRDAAYEAQDVLEEFHFEVLSRDISKKNGSCGSELVRRFFSSHNPVLFNRKMGKLVKKILKRLDEIAEDRSKYNLEYNDNYNYNYNIENRVQRSHSLIIESKVIGREMDTEIIIGKITSDKCIKKDISILSIVGMGGIGKTTLAKLIYKDNRVQTRFENRIWIHVGEEFDNVKIFKSILESFEEDCTSLQLDPLQRKVREMLQGKRFLIVLDDVWNENILIWDDFIDVVNKIGSQGSVILVTTRKEQVDELVGTLGIHRLAPLCGKESWDLFKSRAFENSEEEYEKLTLIGKKIVKKCNGLPLALKALGASLRTKKKEREEWENILKSEIWENENDVILPSLRVSYYHLPPNLKRCFGFCAIFPKGCEIDKDMLIHLWMANGFITETSKSDLFEMGCKFFNQLAEGSFFQEVKKGEKWYDGEIRVLFKIHDMMLDLARNISLEECFNLDQNDYFPDFKIRFLGVNLYGDLANITGFPNLRNLRSFILMGQNRNLISSSFLDSLNRNKCLRALDLSHQNLPNGISFYHFKHLRYLNLSYTNIITLPEYVTRLVYLQILNLNHCEFLLELPKDTKNLINLRHIYLNGCINLRKMPMKLGKLKELRTLNKFVVANELGSGKLSELKDFKLEGVLHLSKLQNVRSPIDAQNANLNLKDDIKGLILEWEMGYSEMVNETDELVFEALKPSNELKMICVKGFGGLNLPNWFMDDLNLNFFEKLVEISISNCERVTNLPHFEKLKSLEVLEIHEMNFVQKIGEINQDFSITFPKLKYLKLTNMARLIQFFGLEKRPIFDKPFKLKIKDCPKLSSIPQIKTIQNLEIENCPLIEPNEGFFSCMIYLEKLVLEGCNNIILLLEEEKNGNHIPIKEILIRKCTKFMFNKSPTFGLWRSFISLNYLSIDSCEGLVYFPDIIIKDLKSLKFLVISYCPNLIGSSEINGLNLHYLTNLETLFIAHCDKMTNFAKYALKPLNSLKIIQLVGLNNISEIPDLPVSLNEILISDCFGIKFLPDNICDLKSLARLKIENLIYFYSFPEEIGDLIELEELMITNCPLNEFPKSFEKQLMNLKCLYIKDCYKLEKSCKSGGYYWPFVCKIKSRWIQSENMNLD